MKTKLFTGTSSRHLPLCVLLALAAFVTPVDAQNYSVNWHKISNGGGTSGNGAYTVIGTIGQPDAGTTRTGGNYSLIGGFWSLVSAVQTIPGPLLTIKQSGNSVTISWPLSPSGFNLQYNSNLANPAGWSTYAGTIQVANGMNSLTIASPIGNVFFRLYHP